MLRQTSASNGSSHRFEPFIRGGRDGFSSCGRLVDIGTGGDEPTLGTAYDGRSPHDSGSPHGRPTGARLRDPRREPTFSGVHRRIVFAAKTTPSSPPEDRVGLGAFSVFAAECPPGTL